MCPWNFSFLSQNNYNVLVGMDPSDVQASTHDQGGASRNNGAHVARTNSAMYGDEEQQKAEQAAGWVVQDKRQKGRLDKPAVQHKPIPQPHAQPHARTPTAAVRIYDPQFPDEENEQSRDEQLPNAQFPDEQNPDEYPVTGDDYGETEAEVQLRLFSEIEKTYPQMPAPPPPFTAPTPPSSSYNNGRAPPVQSLHAQATSHAVSSVVHGSNGFHGGVNLGGVDRMTGRQDTLEERAWHSMGEEEQLRFLAAQQEDWNGPGGAPGGGDGWTLLDQASAFPSSGHHQAQHTTAAASTTPLTAANLQLAQQQQDRAAMGGRQEAKSVHQAAAAPVYAPRVLPLQPTQQERGHPVVIQANPTSHAELVLQQEQLQRLAEEQFQQQQIQQVSLLLAFPVVFLTLLHCF